jgi:ubiquitin C-terminal hydrolase
MDELNEHLLKVENVKSRIDSVVTFEWLQLYKLFKDNHGTILPNRFIERMKQVSVQKNRDEFSSHEQCDSVDFFEFILECIHNSLNLMTPPIKRSIKTQVDKYLQDIEVSDCSIVSNLFLSCSMNRYMSPDYNKIEFDKLEHEYTVSLSIPENNSVSLKDCFSYTFKEELLTGENAWFDEKENVKKNVIKRSYLCHTPKILVLHLKKWNTNMVKKRIKIDIPFILDIQPFTIYPESCEYELFGIINHEGSIHGGHYYASIQKSGLWFSVNDNLIQPIFAEHLIHEGNYCLFYRKIK